MLRNKLLLLFFCTLFSCSEKTFDSSDDLISFIKDEGNGYSQTKMINGIEINITYKPSDILISQELKNKSNSNVSVLREKYKDLLFFDFNLSKDGKEILSALPSSIEEYNMIQNTLTFGMDEKVALLTSKNDTIHLVDCIYPRTYGFSKRTSVLFIFEKNKNVTNTDQLKFCISDLGIGIGEVKFSIPTKLIDNQPTINF